MKILLLILNIIVLLGSGFFFILSLSGGSASDPVVMGTAAMVIASLIGIIGMGFGYKKMMRITFYIFALIGIGLPAIIFQVLSNISK